MTKADRPHHGEVNTSGTTPDQPTTVAAAPFDHTPDRENKTSRHHSESEDAITQQSPLHRQTTP
jgi:hypothetical protein